jgi:hypothetical protein
MRRTDTSITFNEGWTDYGSNTVTETVGTPMPLAEKSVTMFPKVRKYRPSYIIRKMY